MRIRHRSEGSNETAPPPGLWNCCSPRLCRHSSGKETLRITPRLPQLSWPHPERGAAWSRHGPTGKLTPLQSAPFGAWQDVPVPAAFTFVVLFRTRSAALDVGAGSSGSLVAVAAWLLSWLCHTCGLLFMPVSLRVVTCSAPGGTHIPLSSARRGDEIPRGSLHTRQGSGAEGRSCRLGDYTRCHGDLDTLPW